MDFSELTCKHTHCTEISKPASNIFGFNTPKGHKGFLGNTGFGYQIGNNSGFVYIIYYW